MRQNEPLEEIKTSKKHKENIEDDVIDSLEPIVKKKSKKSRTSEEEVVLTNEVKIKKAKKNYLNSKENISFAEEDIPSIQPKKKILNILKNVRESPVTPLTRIQEGFRETSLTPNVVNGFKISSVTPIVPHDKKTKKLNLKRKLQNIKEPSYIPPTNVWTSSGVYIEDRQIERTIPTQSSTTKFKVSVSGNESNYLSEILRTDFPSNAANFKKQKLYNQKGVVRVSSKEIMSNVEKRKFSRKNK